MTDSHSNELPEVVPSPCVSICALDGDDVCVGCFRTGREISYWGRMDCAQQREVLRRCNLRINGELATCLIGEQA
ncbi:DUF1289 domain-containing protein [Alcanivorax sp. 1008]|uniref:DUF1289 domain-containing protein n=1 Tax=Alcanivorax sp. 1008 TaxID=2816853 RepID=UPI001D92AE2A|nr:DUF1289 domain-containing protein [Alcanivorax sp. 1008]MCC1497278.1 DUF1289 domain-containing protein [Alcanivorax sp. 1008]